MNKGAPQTRGGDWARTSNRTTDEGDGAQSVIIKKKKKKKRVGVKGVSRELGFIEIPKHLPPFTLGDL